MKNSPKNPEIAVESATEISQIKRADILKLKKWSSILISCFEIPTIISKLIQGHSVVITEKGQIFTGRVNTDKLRDLGLRVPGKKEGSFDINAHVDSDISMLENQDIHTKQYVNSAAVLRQNTHVYSEKFDSIVDMFFDAWKYQEENHPENIQINFEKSPMGHDYMLVKIKGISSTAKISVKTGKLMYMISPDGTEKPIK